MALAAAIVAWQMLVPPVVSMANNGDFGKLTGTWDLGAPIELEYKYARLTYRFGAAHHWESQCWSSEALLVIPALALNLPFAATGKFDIRAMGVVHAALFLTTLWLALPLFRLAGGRKRLLMGAALVLFCDVLYVSSFNSLYMDTAAYLFLLLAVTLGLRAAVLGEGRAATFALVAAALVATSKLPHTAAGVLLGAGIVMTAPGGWRRLRGALALAAAAAFYVPMAAPADYAFDQLFDAIFPTLIAHSPAPERELQELGLDPSWKRYSGRNAYEPAPLASFQEDRPAFLRRTSYGRLAAFYLRRPDRALDTFRRNLDRPELTRSEMLGNYDPSAGFPPYARSYGFSAASSLKTVLFGGLPALYLAFILLLSALWLVLARRFPSGVWRLGGAVVGAALAELAIGTLAESADVLRHLFFHHALTDVVILGVLAAAFAGRSPRS